jgi:MoaA/NifB/PqqE/SkfB family radical SAM enzyme
MWATSVAESEGATVALEDIGFYTLSDARVKQAGVNSPLWRCELVLTARCNFKCPYCRHVGGKDLPFDKAASVIRLWGEQGLKNIRFSGGEPTMYPRLLDLVRLSKLAGIDRIAVSTNGSADIELYKDLFYHGVNDFSVSLDACCAADGDQMAGGIEGAWQTVVDNIREMSTFTYVTVGVVLTEQNAPRVNDIIRFADSLGVADIRVIPAAQDGAWLKDIWVDQELQDRHPILKYRVTNVQNGESVRGLLQSDSARCGLVMDDMAVMGNKHYPCIIYMREKGQPIGTVGPNMRSERAVWSLNHDTHDDPICSKNCLDVCRDYNNRYRSVQELKALHYEDE